MLILINKNCSVRTIDLDFPDASISKPTITCSKPTMETHEESVKSVQNKSNKDTRTRSNEGNEKDPLTSFWCLYC